MAKKPLKRSSSNRVIAGTVGGLGEYFGLSRAE
ncbi:PspC domain-containing protein [Lactococcus cremoris]